MARLTELKGLAVLLDAMGELIETIPDLHLTVVGDGEHRTRLETPCPPRSASRAMSTSWVPSR